MSTDTPETPVASTPPTPENVAEMLTMGDNDYHDGNYWHPSIGADGNVVHIGVTAYSEDGDKLPEQQFRAVVVEGEGPVVVASQEFLAAARALYRSHVAAGSLSTEQAMYALYEVQAALDALTPDQVAVLAGDDENGGADDV